MNNPHQSLLIIISAPSGTGKTTLCERVLKDYADRVVKSTSCTTRPPRGQEVHGREYFFLSVDEFEDRKSKGEFVEWAQVHGHYYGTSKSVIEDALNQGRSVLLDIDVQGAESLRKLFSDRCLSIFLVPPSLEALKSRLVQRGTDTSQTIEHRLNNAKEELQQADYFDYVITNDDLEIAYRELCQAIDLKLA